jgi:hypothetical protein
MSGEFMSFGISGYAAAAATQKNMLAGNLAVNGSG